MARVFVITGPSGVGKGTLIRGVRASIPELELTVSATTRGPRPREHDGVDYHFLTPEQFEAHVAAGDFLEYADYAGHRYGTLRREVDQRLERGRPVVLEIELQGARQVRQAIPDSVAVFIAPPSREALSRRLAARGTDSPDQVQARLETAERELEAAREFRHVVVNDRLAEAVQALAEIMRRELAD